MNQLRPLRHDLYTSVKLINVQEDELPACRPNSLWSRPELIARGVHRPGVHLSDHCHVQRVRDDSTREAALAVAAFTRDRTRRARMG